MLVVQKYGGTSVADADCIRRVAQRIARRRNAGDDVVVVVSARGDRTDELIELALQISPNPPRREMDMLLATGEQESIALLAMALHELGVAAVSLTGAQVGILTDTAHTKARIVTVDTSRIRRELEEGHVVVVAGFQGVTTGNDITTLGRGGSDATAVALAAVLEADVCEIYTDVEGVYTADPRVVESARLVKYITYDEMMELAGLGAKVLQDRAVQFAKRFSVPLCVRSSFSDGEGTMVVEKYENMEQVMVSGAALDEGEVKVTLRDVPDRPGVAAAVFSAIAARNINVDMIVQNVSAEGKTDLSFTVGKGDLEDVKAVIEEVSGEVGARTVEVDEDVAKVSVVGFGMRSQPGVAYRMFSALAESGINIQMISTSEIKISCLVDVRDGRKALAAVHDAFQLGGE